jgi:hypothetical protein
MSDRQQHQTGRARVWLRLIVSVVVVAVLFVVLWVGVRAILARDELLGAVPIANRIGSQVLSDNGQLSEDLEELQNRASNAANLTSDPIWRAAEVTPFLGNNLTAFREAASLVDDLATGALPPLSSLSESFTLDSLQPKDGVLDLDVFSVAQPLLGEARTALESANASATAIDTESTIPQIGSAVDQVVELVSRAKNIVDGLDTAASLLPSMLGSNEPRSYLLLSLNNSELRATGGLPGAIAVVNADRGALSLGELSSATALGEFDEPVLALSEGEEVLYGDALATFMHDVNYTPDFARSGELAQAMWAERTGQLVDGVIAVDPIALGYVLRATGPIEAGSGISLSSDNAAEMLLNGAYSQFPDPLDQDAFFATVTGKIFEAVTAGGTDSSALLNALSQSAGEDRIHLWSATPDEQSQIKETALAGVVPVSSSASTAYGVYFNDATGAKMDFYLDGAIAIASGVCRNDQRPNFEVKVKLDSSAPVDAATSLPTYVTGDGIYGVEPGNIRTNVFIYAPKGSVPFSVTIDGEEFAFVTAEDGEHSVAGVTVELAPGQSSVVSMKFVGLAGAAKPVTLQNTPMARAVETSLDNYLDCSDVAPAPTENEEQSGALAPIMSGVGSTLDSKFVVN